MMTTITPSRYFWPLSLAAWSLYAVFPLLLTVVFGGELSSGAVLISVWLALLLFLISGGIRHLANRQHWWDAGIAGLARRLVLGVLTGATLAQVLVALVLLPALALGWVDLPGGVADYRPSATLVYWLNTVLVLTLWVCVWAGLHSLRRARASELARLRAEAERNALERDALRARLNPHFVFNALNNLRALINEDPARAREMVTRLSSTLRHALEHGGEERVPLAEELAVVDDYLAIEAVHFEDRMTVRRDIEPAARDAQLPAMSLQLLVENAIKHGIAVSPRGGELAIAARLVDGMLQLDVYNPVATGRAAEAGHGIGLAYLRKQLESTDGNGLTGHFSLQRDGMRMRARLEIRQ